MEISIGQQLAICGRTGRYVILGYISSSPPSTDKLRPTRSGKSTLLLTLLRLLEIQSGTIKIDGIDLNLVPRSLIRQRCYITVAQDPLILGHASLRFNLDVSKSLSHSNPSLNEEIY
jgi:ABC-type multidrug transport system fused ATPase/permease subunit